MFHVMVMFKVESIPIEFVADVNEDGFSFVHEHRLCMFGKFQSFSVMVMKDMNGSNVHVQKCV